MKPTARFLLGKHPMDLLRIAVKTVPEGPTPPVICMTEGRSMATMALGIRSANEYPGLAGIPALGYQRLTRRVTCDGRDADVIFPAGIQFDSHSRGELIDRMRASLGDGAGVTVLIDPERIANDLPPLNEGDTVECYWEIRDPLDSSAINAFSALRSRLDHQPSRFLGIKLYTREADAAANGEGMAHEIAQASGLTDGGPVLVLNESPMPVIQSQRPLPFEILGVLTRSIIHGLGNTLTCISGNAMVARNAPGNQELLHTVLGDIQSGAEQANNLINQLRDARERLLANLPTNSLAVVEDAIRASFSGEHNWNLIVRAEVDGGVQGDLRWLSFATRTLLAVGRGAGDIELTARAKAPLAASLEFGPFEYPVLEITGPGSVDADPLELSASEEYIRSVGGWLERSDDKVSIYIPLQQQP